MNRRAPATALVAERAGPGGERAQWVAAGAACFPPRLRGIPQQPAGLWMLSELGSAERIRACWLASAVAIVGSRGASAAGREMAQGLAWDLARAGVVVVSGLARGIDAAAHRGALLGGGLTVAVMGSGLDRCYPPEHTPLAKEVMRHGVLLSERPCGAPVLPWCFPQRNRLISGLADIVVVVEGEARSGARHTVAFGAAQGRDVMAVPRDPLLPGSVLPDRLLRDGAAPVVDGRDILHALAALGGRTPRRRHGHGGGARAGGSWREKLQALLGSGRALGIADIAARLGAGGDVGSLMAELATLEVEGVLRRDREGRYHLEERI